MAHQAGTCSGFPVRDDRGYDVFLNFRGPESRFTVADVLYNALIRAGFRVFIDNEEIRKGETIAGELLSAITNSKIYIPIFSKNYASSKWCLRELALMVDLNKDLKDGDKKVILPVFYDVDASDVKLNSKLYRIPMRKHEKESAKDAERWREALTAVGRIKGYNLEEYGLFKLAEVIQAEVFNKLKPSGAFAPNSSSLIGIQDQVEAIIKELELDNDSPDPKFIVIHGVGGIGKTTIAKYIFKKFTSRFQGSCMLLDVRRKSSMDGVVKLQQQLLVDTLHLKFIEVSDVDDGIEKLSWRLRNRRVLIFLDDVWMRGITL